MLPNAPHKMRTNAPNVFHSVLQTGNVQRKCTSCSCTVNTILWFVWSIQSVRSVWKFAVDWLKRLFFFIVIMASFSPEKCLEFPPLHSHSQIVFLETVRSFLMLWVVSLLSSVLTNERSMGCYSFKLVMSVFKILVD